MNANGRVFHMINNTIFLNGAEPKLGRCALTQQLHSQYALRSKPFSSTIQIPSFPYAF